MKSRWFSVLASSLLSCTALVVISEGACLFKECLRDDASLRADSMFGIPILVAYVLVSWLFVYPAILWLSRWWGGARASLLVSTGFAVAMAGLFHRPSVDGSFLHTALYLVPWFGTSWFIAGLCAAALWPDAGSTERANGA